MQVEIQDKRKRNDKREEKRKDEKETKKKQNINIIVKTWHFSPRPPKREEKQKENKKKNETSVAKALEKGINLLKFTSLIYIIISIISTYHT